MLKISSKLLAACNRVYGPYDMHLCADVNSMIQRNRIYKRDCSVFTNMHGNVLITPNDNDVVLFAKLAREYVDEDHTHSTVVSMLMPTDNSLKWLAKLIKIADNIIVTHDGCYILAIVNDWTCRTSYWKNMYNMRHPAPISETELYSIIYKGVSKHGN